MLDLNHLATAPGLDIQIFNGNSVAAGVTWQTWNKPRGKSMAFMMTIGSGGGGGTGVIGAASTAAGGGGGGSGGQTSIVVPLSMVPDVLHVSAGVGSNAAGIATYISIHTSITANHVLCYANGGAVGGNAAGAVAGAAGAGATIAVVGSMPLGWSFANLALVGQPGIIGGTTVAGAALTLPVTGLLVTGGTGGGGQPAAAAVGTAGGAFTVPAAPSPYPPQIGGIGGSAATTPPTMGSNGHSGAIRGLFFNYGGTGGGSTHGSATGAGLVQASGGNGGIGSGGGGMGGAFTGSTAGVKSTGGSGIAIIISW